MEYQKVSEIANRAKNIGDLYFKTYSKFITTHSLSRIERDDLLNNLYHVINATESLSEDDIVAMSKIDPLALGAGIVISLEVYASFVAEEGEMLRLVIRRLNAKIEEGYFYPLFRYKHDMKRIDNHQKKLLDYKHIIERDYLTYIISLGKEKA